ncbi:MAG: acylphosphatase [Chitinophagales bacterium]
MGIRSLSVNVKGRVQGVYFRMSTKEKADELGLKGFVRNEKDGSVYVEVEGEENMLVKMLEWLKIGPTNANVTALDIQEQSIKGYASFLVKRQ